MHLVGSLYNIVMFSLSRIQMNHFLRGFPTKILKVFLVHHPTNIQGPDFTNLKPICGPSIKRFLGPVMSTQFIPLKTIILKWSEVSYGEVLGDKSTMYIRMTLNWGYLTVLWLFHLVCILYCGCFHMFCNVWMCVCMGVLVICVHVLTVFLLFVLCFFVLFRVCIFILMCFVRTSVRTTATEWQTQLQYVSK